MNKFFLSSETGFLDESSLKDLRKLTSEIQQKLNEKLQMSDYGVVINSIGIVPSIFPTSFYTDNPKHKERRLVNESDKDADIRLRIDFNKWVSSDLIEKNKLLLENIIKSIRIVGEKVKKGFDAEKLEADIRKEFDYYGNF